VTAGRGVRVGDGDRPEAIAPAPGDFRTSQEVRRLTDAEAKKRHEAWLAFREESRADENLLLYFPFDAPERDSRVLLDQARNRRKPHDGAIVGCSWTAGRWPGKRALLFKSVTD